MAFGVKLWFFMALLTGVLIANLQLQHAFGQPQVPCYFIFGDSLVDNGNNNRLLTQAKANYRPYGIDFGNGTPTGRFTNGRNLADFFAQLLGFESPIPPFASASGPNIIKGVNYGSGSAGIRDESGNNLGEHISLNRQLLNHQITISNITPLLLRKNIPAKQYLSKCLYTVTIGSNDYINNYLMPQFFPTSRLYTPTLFADVLSKQYFQQLKTLYKLGARKVAICGLGVLGCIPEELSRYPANNQSGCVDFINNAVGLFNDKLKMMVDDLNTKFSDAKYIYINFTSISSSVAMIPEITVSKAPCCEVSRNFARGLCVPGGATCSNRSHYTFWDNFHPTQIVNREMANLAYNAGSPLDAYPFDIRTLVQLDLMKIYQQN